jgi:hypothetical protein
MLRKSTVLRGLAIDRGDGFESNGDASLSVMNVQIICELGRERSELNQHLKSRDACFG